MPSKVCTTCKPSAKKSLNAKHPSAIASATHKSSRTYNMKKSHVDLSNQPLPEK